MARVASHIWAAAENGRVNARRGPGGGHPFAKSIDGYRADIGACVAECKKRSDLRGRTPIKQRRRDPVVAQIHHQVIPGRHCSRVFEAPILVRGNAGFPIWTHKKQSPPCGGLRNATGVSWGLGCFSGFCEASGRLSRGVDVGFGDLGRLHRNLGKVVIGRIGDGEHRLQAGDGDVRAGGRVL